MKITFENEEMEQLRVYIEAPKLLEALKRLREIFIHQTVSGNIEHIVDDAIALVEKP